MTLTLADARAIADHVVQAAGDQGLAVSCCVVDAAGIELTTVRMDGAPWFTADVSRAKARTAAVMHSSTRDLGDLQRAYPDLMLLIDDQLPFRATTLPGGITITDGPVHRGAVGVSGATPDQDIACAEAAVASWLGR